MLIRTAYALRPPLDFFHSVAVIVKFYESKDQLIGLSSHHNLVIFEVISYPAKRKLRYQRESYLTPRILFITNTRAR